MLMVRIPKAYSLVSFLVLLVFVFFKIAFICFLRVVLANNQMAKTRTSLYEDSLLLHLKHLVILLTKQHILQNQTKRRETISKFLSLVRSPKGKGKIKRCTRTRTSSEQCTVVTSTPQRCQMHHAPLCL